MRPLHESVAKEKLGEILLIEVENKANNGLLESFPTKISEISTIVTRHPTLQRSLHIVLYRRIGITT